MNTDFMRKALEIAAISDSDIPVGAVIVKDGNIISLCHNEKEFRNDVTAHAEILAIREASKKLSNWRLTDCDMYVTLEPCPMCAWAIMQARIKNLYFGSYDNIYGAFSALKSLESLCNSKLNFKGGIMEEECNRLLDNYFKGIR